MSCATITSGWLFRRARGRAIFQKARFRASVHVSARLDDGEDVRWGHFVHQCVRDMYEANALGTFLWIADKHRDRRP